MEEQMSHSILELRPDAWIPDPEQSRPGTALSAHVANPSSPTEIQRVLVIGVRMRLGEMINLAIKWGAACLVAGLIFSLVGGALYFAVVTILASFTNR